MRELNRWAIRAKKVKIRQDMESFNRLRFAMSDEKSAKKYFMQLRFELMKLEREM